MTVNLSKYQALELAKAKREALIARHAEELAKADADVSREQLKLGLGPFQPTGRRRDVAMSKLKSEFHAEMRKAAEAKGYYKMSGRGRGRPDVERLRLER